MPCCSDPAGRRLDRQLRVEDDHRIAGDAHGRCTPARRSHLDVDTPGTIDEPTLVTDETAGPIGARGEQAVVHEINTKHSVRVPTYGVLGHVDDRAEHP